MKKPTNPFAALAAELSKPAVVPSRDDGWREFDEVRVESGLSHCKTRKTLRDGIRAGLVELWSGMATGVDGRPNRCVKYRMKKISAKKLAT